ncbi:hypothetical protein [Rhizohabitans arisaemae]|uniref:hypothetical protein n=1 Tax=Rhizohabitans arisaemae TaxID=2720610 RepID=UPI0024B1BAA3|nr:hypothetical protein [Rhizohabitans arisaemae]
MTMCASDDPNTADLEPERPGSAVRRGTVPPAPAAFGAAPRRLLRLAAGIRGHRGLLLPLTVAGLLSTACAVPPALAAHTRGDAGAPSPSPTASPTPKPGPSESAKNHPKKRRCFARTFFKIDSLAPRNFNVPRTRYVDGPGGSMTVSVTREHEVRAFMEHEYEKQVDVSETTHEFKNDLNISDEELVRHFRKQLTPHLELRHMVFTGHEYTHRIRKGMYGNMWYRVRGYRIGWSAWSVLGTCRQVKIISGIANIPSRLEGWVYWETRRPWCQGRVIRGKGSRGARRGAKGRGGAESPPPDVWPRDTGRMDAANEDEED